MVKIDIPLPSSASYHAATDYLARGWRVLPIWWAREDGVCACGNPACEAVGKHPIAAGSTGASDEAAQVLRWWTSYPRANPAIGTGEGLIAIDLDDKPAAGKDGLGNWSRLVAENGGVPETVTTMTPSGGQHLYFSASGHVPSSQSSAALGAGIDVRGHHGYIVSAPWSLYGLSVGPADSSVGSS